MGRGQLTEEISKKAKEFLGREIDTTELRLYPYLDYCTKNSGSIDMRKIDNIEVGILEKLEEEGHIETYGLYSYFSMSKDFYDFIQEILWLAYVENKMED